jgi:hypothetical protein
MPREKAVPVQKVVLRVRHASGMIRLAAAAEWTLSQLHAAVRTAPELAVSVSGGPFQLLKESPPLPPALLEGKHSCSTILHSIRTLRLSCALHPLTV